MQSSQQTRIAELVAHQRRGYSLEQPFYNDPDVFAFEKRALLLNSWWFAGHASRIPEPGDYFLYPIAGESIIVVRGRQGEINALFNVCRHRGSRVCLEEDGHANSFVCPYHAWTYATDGDLLAARTMPADFDASTHGLHRCRVQIVEGLIYISLGEQPEDFTPVAVEGRKYLADHGLVRAKVAHREAWPVHANWKLMWENFAECYHCGHTHPEYCSVMDDALANSTGSAQVKQAFETYTQSWRERCVELGRLTDSLPTDRRKPYGGRRHPIKPGYLTQSADGGPVAPLMGNLTEYDGGITTFSFYPMHYTVASCDHAVAFRFTPWDAHHSEVEVSWLVYEEAVAGVDYQLDALLWMWRETTIQDKQLVEDNQAGVNSCRYEPGPYAACETGVVRFQEWYLSRLSEAC
jgi:phenylpropionate dioxygenase-like ring-hydroxylating dioxygenase large terminal subunit